MKTVNLSQGSEEWKSHRSTHFNASDAPAMLGVSQYKTRSQLLKEIATGLIDEVDAGTQRRFNDGHRFEALARPMAEQIIGDDLSPVVGVNGKMSASFDGITFDESVCFEHKTLNDKLRGITDASDLPDQYRVQMEQQLLVSGAEKCLFMATKWNGDELAEPAMHVWYYPTPALRAEIIAGWAQFEIDLANYQHIESTPEVIAAPMQDLPALSIQVNGSISLISNLQKFGARLNEFVYAINKDPSDDQGFADAEAAIKTLQNAQDALEAAEANALAQTSDIDDMRKTVKLYADTARTTRLMLEKMVKARKESIRIEIIQDAKTEFADHYRALELEIKPIALMIGMPDFAGAIKGKKTIASLREAAGTALRNGKMEADTLAADIRAKLSWYKESSSGYGFLFSDMQSIITSNGMEAFRAIVLRRIDDHKAAEAAKEEARRVAIQAEEEAKAKAAQEAVLAAERAKMEAEVKAAAEVERQRVAAEVKAQLEAQAAKRAAEEESARIATENMFAEVKKAEAQAERDAEAVAIEERRRIAQCKEQERPSKIFPLVSATRPTRLQLVSAIAEKFNVSGETAVLWLISEFDESESEAA